VASGGDKNNKGIFINCPFDSGYRQLLRSMLFTIVYLGYKPRIASESLNSADNRINKICELIKQTHYSIHDVSKCTASETNEVFRMNMPFELGIDYGNYIFNNHVRKMLVLEGRRYDYQKALSDISGVDVNAITMSLKT
jgi:hypothetical protein